VSTLQEESRLDLAKLDEIIARYRDQKWPVIPLLQEVQDEFGYIPPEAIPQIARGVSLFPAQIQGIVSFYEQFHTTPRGRYTVRVCRGTACHVRGGSTILKIVKRDLDVGEGETTPDMQFTLETVPCLGTCFLAPAMMVNKDYYGRLAPPKLRSILRQYGDAGE